MADVYGTLAGFRTYHDARGTDTAAIEDDEVDAARLVASEWLDAIYRSSFPGLKVGQRAQVREWPRSGGTDIYGYAISSATVPTEMENATYEAALREARSPGSLSKDWTPGKYKRAAVEGAVSVEYVSFASAGDVQTRFTIIGQILAPILTGSGAGSLSSLTGDVCRV